MKIISKEEVLILYLTKNKCNELLITNELLKFEYEDKKYLVVEDAQITSDIIGNITDIYYMGTAVLLQDVLDIVNGQTKPFDQEIDEYELERYIIEWDIYEKYLNEEGNLNSENDYIESLESDNPVPVLDDEQDACDWNQPRDIFKMDEL